MDISAIEAARASIGIALMVYVGFCLKNQKVWLRGPIGFFSETFDWGAREENQTVFMLHVIVGTAFGIWLIIGPFLF